MLTGNMGKNKNIDFFTLALAHDNIKVAEALYDTIKDDQPDETGFYRLHHAVRLGASQCFKLLYKKNVQLLLYRIKKYFIIYLMNLNNPEDAPNNG